MPPVCDHCKKIGHSAKRCKLAPKICQVCKSVSHDTVKFPRSKFAEGNGRKTHRGRSMTKTWSVISDKKEEVVKQGSSQVAQNGLVAQTGNTKLGIVKDYAEGETSCSTVILIHSVEKQKEKKKNAI